MNPAVLPLLINALLLGLRHGLDVDHLCAITDIVGTARCARQADNHVLSGVKGLPAIDTPLRLSAFYVCGHAVVVALLGLAAILVGVSLPPSIDAMMEKLVGATLILLGTWLAYCALVKGHSGSRGAAVLQLLTGREHTSYGKGTAFSVGILHGIGAETGTQILLLATIAGTNERWLSVALLMAFIGGLLLSNSAVAVVTSAGFTATNRFDRLKAVLAVAAAACSVFIGLAMLGLVRQK